MKTAEEWHHSARFATDKRATNPNWQCCCLACELTRQIQQDVRDAALVEAAEVLAEIPKNRQSGSKRDEYMKAGLRAGYIAILALRSKPTTNKK